MKCSLMNQDGTIKTHFSFNIQCSNKIRWIKVEVENYRIKIGQGSNLWRDYFLSSLFKGIYDNACLILKLKKKQTQNNQSLSKKKICFFKSGVFLN